MKWVNLTFLVSILSGCGIYATPSGPIVDMYGVDPRQYAYDRANCANYADQVRTTEQAIRGAAVGAAIGGITGGGDGAAKGAGAGTVIGGLKGIGDRSTVIRNCLRNRGYSILN